MCIGVSYTNIRYGVDGYGREKEQNFKNAKKRKKAAEGKAVDNDLQWNAEAYGEAL